MICCIIISDMFKSKISNQFWNIYKSDLSDILYYIRISDMFESKISTRFGHVYKSDCSDVLCQNFCHSDMFESKILLVFGTFTSQTVLIYCIRISDTFESKNFTHFGHIYKSDYSDISCQNFSCKTRYIIKKFKSKKIWQR